METDMAEIIQLPKRQAEQETEICNQVTGQVIRFLQTGEDTNGRLLEMESVYAPFSDEPPVHYHPVQDEYFKVLAGELAVRLAGDIKVYTAGEEIHILPGTPHSMWNPGRVETLVTWKALPAMDTEALLRQMIVLANAGDTNIKGVPQLPVMVYLLKKYNKTFRICKLPIGVIKTLFILLKPLFILLNYKSKFNI
jgi:quercetin dioxygenase-like cupin family protein